MNQQLNKALNDAYCIQKGEAPMTHAELLANFDKMSADARAYIVARPNLNPYTSIEITLDNGETEVTWEYEYDDE